MRRPCKTSMLTLSVLCLLAFATGTAQADTVIIANGDRLTGKVVRLEEGTLTFETSYAGAIEIKAEEIAGIETEAPVDLRLDEGEAIRGTLATTDNDWITVGASADRQPLRTRWDKIAAINPPPVLPARLRGSITVGGNLQSGNTERSSASVALDAVRRDAKHRFSLGFLHNYAEEDDEVDTRNTFGTFKYDYFFTNKIFGYLAVEALKDEFKDLNLRTVIGPGAGYQFWDDERSALGLEAGVAFFNEDRDEGEDDSWITGRLGGNFRYRLFDRIEFSEKLVFYPNLEDFGQYTLRNEAALSSQIVYGWALKVTNVVDYDSDPDSEDVKKTDIHWILGLQYEF